MQHFVFIVFFIITFSLQANEKTPTSSQTEYRNYLLNADEFFQQQLYQAALTDYQQSYQLMPLDSTLYNIAICHFKLGQWQLANNSFTKLKTTQPDSDLIEYNIAITEKKLGDNEQANQRFVYLSEFASDESIAALADQQLNPNQATLASYAADHGSVWQHMISLQLGNDSNIILPDDETYTEQSDQFADLLASTSWLSSSDIANAWVLDATYYGSKYREAKNYEISMYSLSGRKYFTPEKYLNTKFYLGLEYESINLAGSDYLDTTSFILGAHYRVSKTQKVLFDVKFKDISDADEQYNYLAGSSNVFKITWKQDTESGYWKIGSSYQINDKNDRSYEDYFTSYSYDRAGIFAESYWQYQKWDFTLTGQYYYSEYHDNNVYYGETETLREDDKVSLLANITYNISNSIAIHTELDVANNSSTLEESDYDQNTFAVGFTLLF